jgi:hypothetical protein
MTVRAFSFTMGEVFLRRRSRYISRFWQDLTERNVSSVMWEQYKESKSREWVCVCHVSTGEHDWNDTAQQLKERGA